MESILRVSNLHASVEETPILQGVDLDIGRGAIHAVMGPNGSGKSTLANVLMGNPAYNITDGSIVFKGQELVVGDDWTDEQIAEVTTTKRGKAGMFLAFQYPEEIPGVTIVNFLRQALTNRTGVELTVLELRLKVADTMRELGMDPSFADRYLNEGFSGGERKRNEVLQMAVLEPELAIMDETDSGLDIDALRIVAEGVNRLRSPARSFLVITHYQRLLEYITPDVVHILLDGKIVETGGPEVAERIEGEGYDAYRAAVGA
jgi:Fe-S cluster assembly ATP-binding protein